MLECLFSRSTGARRFRTNGVHPDLIRALNARQELVAGYDFDAFQDRHVLIAGLGALGSWFAYGCAAKGVGEITGCDHDEASLSNRTRQNFGAKDVGRNKALATAKTLIRRRLFPLKLNAHPCTLQEQIASDFDLSTINLIADLTDNDESRVFGAEVGHRRGIPVLTAGLAEDARSLYVAVQRPGHACIVCIRPHILGQKHRAPCGVPGSIDSVWVAVGFLLFALEQLICGNELRWNFRTSYLDGSRPDHCSLVERNPDCPLCGSARAETPAPSNEGHVEGFDA